MQLSMRAAYLTDVHNYGVHSVQSLREIYSVNQLSYQIS